VGCTLISEYIIKFAVDSIKGYLKLPVENSYGMELVDFDVGILLLSMLSYLLEKHPKSLLEMRVVLSQDCAARLNAY
jgi:hypothetical protein